MLCVPEKYHFLVINKRPSFQDKYATSATCYQCSYQELSRSYRQLETNDNIFINAVFQPYQ